MVGKSMETPHMARSFRRSTMFLAFALVAIALALLVDRSASSANNPPTSVLPTVAIDPTEPPPDTDITTADQSPVYAMIEAHGRYYVGGKFIEVGGKTQRGLAAIDVATGQLDPTFRPVLSGSDRMVTALALSPDGNDLYVAGRFLQIDGVAKSRVAKLDARTGAVDPAFTANADAVVETIATDGNSVWIGGKFNNVGGQAAKRLARLSASTGAVNPAWVGFNADGTVLDIELRGATLWVGGNFNNIAGTTGQKLVPLNASNGTVLTSWAPAHPETHKVLALSVTPDGSKVIVATAGSASNAPQGGNALRAYSTTGSTLWQRINAGDIQAVEATNSTVYAGTHGNFTFTVPAFKTDGTANPAFPANGYVESPNNANAVRRNKLYSVSAASGALNPWDPNLDSTDGVWELSSGPSGLLVGGDFRNVFNPTGTPGQQAGAFTPHFVVFPGHGNLGNKAPEPLFTVDCAGTSCNFDASASLDNGSIASYAWVFGNGQTASGVNASGFLANNTTHDVTLTVTDNAGASASRTEKVAVGNGGLPIRPVDTVAVSGFNNQFAAPIPTTAQAGDVAIAFLSLNTNTTTATTNRMDRSGQ